MKTITSTKHTAYGQESSVIGRRRVARQDFNNTMEEGKGEHDRKLSEESGSYEEVHTLISSLARVWSKTCTADLIFPLWERLCRMDGYLLYDMCHGKPCHLNYLVVSLIFTVLQLRLVKFVDFGRYRSVEGLVQIQSILL